MNNIYFLILETIISYILLIIIYKKYKVEGIYNYIIIAFILSNIMTLKMITIENFDINLGIPLISTIFVASNIIVQNKGTEEIKKLTLTLIAISIVSFTIIYLNRFLNSSTIDFFTNKSYDNIFIGSERIYFANITTILYTLLINSKLYHYLKAIKNKIWISNILSSIITQFIVSILFTIIAYTFEKEIIDIIEIIILRYLISIIVCLIGTINIYIARKIER